MSDASTQIAGGCVLAVIGGSLGLFLAICSSAPGGDPTPEERDGREQAAHREEAACRQDLQCWGDRHAAMAGFRCASEVERLAAYSHQWTDGILESKFPRFMWKDREAGILTYMGDRIQFQNGFGAWVNHSYFCDFDPRRESVVSATATEGLLPR